MEGVMKLIMELLKLRMFERREGERMREEGERERNRVRIVMVVEGGKSKIDEIFKRIDKIVGKRRLGNEEIREEDEVLKIERIVVVDMEKEKGWNKKEDRKSEMKDIEIDIEIDIDEVEGSKKMEGIRSEDVMSVEDVIVLMI